MNKIKFDETKQKGLKIISKIISIIALIGKILVYVAAPCIILLLVVAPILLNKIDVKDNTFIVDSKYNIQVIEDEKGVTLKYKDETLLVEDDAEEIIKIKDVMQNHSKGFIIAYVEFSFAATLVILVLLYMVLRYLRKLFENIYKADTPFTLENVKHLKKIAYFLIAFIVLPYIMDLVFNLIFKANLGIEINTTNVIEILFLFAMAYIFEYGYIIQSKSKLKIYGDNNE